MLLPSTSNLARLSSNWATYKFDLKGRSVQALVHSFNLEAYKEAKMYFSDLFSLKQFANTKA